jgi:hypothetical protein
MSSHASTRLTLVLSLALIMLTTRLFHFEFPPDASWAVFFMLGYWLYGVRVFAAFMAGAVAVDYLATQHMGISSYCLSIAYLPILPAYAMLWLGGRWAARHRGNEQWRSYGSLALSLVLAVSLCFLITNGSFYWFGGRTSAPTLAGWMARLQHWYPHFLAVPCAYVGAAIVVQWIGARRLHRPHAPVT